MRLIFEWDEAKSRQNQVKHQVGFDEVKTIFNDPFLVSFPDVHHSENEQRLISIGVSNDNRLLLVVHTEIEANDAVFIRIISARKTTATERKVYEES